MFEFDPTGVDASEIITSFEEEMSIDKIAELQSFEASRLRALSKEADNGVTSEVAARTVIQERPEESEGPTSSTDVGNPQPPVPLRKVSGRYRGNNGIWQLELRVDVDGRNPLQMISGDFYRVSGATTTYFGSFLCRSVSITSSFFSATITGVMEATFSTSYSKIRLRIPRIPVISRPPDATVQFQTLTGIPGATYVCPFESSYFRTVLLEEDRTQGVTSFQRYNTGALPSGGPARDLTVMSAYQEAGIEMQPTGGADIVPDSATATDANQTWSDAELHASMEHHFTQWRNEPGWLVWLLHAQLHDLGPGLLGIMFDSQGQQRQGAATFYAGQSGNLPQNLRSQLYTCVHELGHCFNLFHSFHKEFMTPPRPNRPQALSYMNYPQRFPDGETAFWNTFPFQFDRDELVHLRHAFRDEIIMGGADFGIGAALENSGLLRSALRDDSGLKLELDSNHRYILGEPVSVSIRLTTTDQRGKRANASLHPNFGFVRIGIEKPDGRVVYYQPLINHCVEDRGVLLDAARPSVETSAFIGYGKGGWYFDQPGFYKIRALYHSYDGSVVLSNILNLWISSPKNESEDEIVELVIGDQQGTLLYLLGSDAEELRKGNDAFELLLDKYPDHPIAAYARVVKANNEAREFKTITADNRLYVRSSNLKKVNSLLGVRVKTTSRAAGPTERVSSALMQQMISGAEMKVEAAEHQIPVHATRRAMEMAEQTDLPENITRFLIAQTPQMARELVQASNSGPSRKGNSARNSADPRANK